MCKASSVLCDLTTMEISNILILFYVGNCKRLRISQLFFIVSVHRSSQPSLSCLFTTFTLTEINNSPAAQIGSLIFVYYLRTFHLLPSSQSTYKLGSLLMNVCPCNPLTR